MVLVDTSVWVDHLRQGDKVLADLLMLGQVCMHPMIIGELACGNLHKRDQLIALWQGLPSITEASHSEALYCLAKNDLSGKGIGFVDLHLITATLLTPSTLIWTRDRRLKAAAQALNISSLAD